MRQWRPSNPMINDAICFRGFSSKPVNHPMTTIESIYESLVTDPGDDVLPFIWGAGLLSHPNFLQRTKAFIKTHHLNHNVHLCKSMQ